MTTAPFTPRRRRRLAAPPLPVKTLTPLLLAALLTGSSVRAEPPGDPAQGTPIMTVDELRPGQRAVGRTVFQGTQVDSFDLEILGVMRGFTPGGDLILARAEGDSVRRMGIVAGMSGSPIYVDGRLIGALAYGWPFSREPIAGITPIAEMLDILQRESLPNRLEDSGGPEFSPQEIAPSPDGATEGLPGGKDPLDQSSLGPAPEDPVPIRTPLTVSGFAAPALEFLRNAFDPLGMSVVHGGAGGGGGPLAGDPAGPVAGDQAAALVPGSAMAVVLAAGDASISAVGTVTYVDDKTILGFGHPLFQSGNTDLPLAAAFVHATIPLESRSFKIASAGKTVGLITGDRRAGVSGHIGMQPDLIPMDVTIAAQESAVADTFHYDIIRNRSLTPTIAAVLTMNSVLAGEGMAEERMLDMHFRAQLTDGPDLVWEDRMASPVPPLNLAQRVLRSVQILLGNPFAPPRLERLTVSAKLGPSGQWGWIEGAATQRDKVAPGDTLDLTVDLHPYRGEREEHTVRVPIPSQLRDGKLLVRVCDADSALASEITRKPESFVPRSLDHLISILGTERPHDAFYVQLIRKREGRLVNGLEYPNLPPSVLNTMRVRGDTRRLDAVTEDRLAELRFDVPFQVVGSEELVIRVERDELGVGKTR